MTVTVWCSTPITNHFTCVSQCVTITSMVYSQYVACEHYGVTFHSSNFPKCFPKLIKTVIIKNFVTRQFIILSLLRGCIEANPRPPKKMKRITCVFCGRITGKHNCSCQVAQNQLLVTVENLATSVESPVVADIGKLYSLVADSIVQQPLQQTMLQLCLRLGIPYVSVTTNMGCHDNLLLVNFVPDFCHDIGGDGNCLFASLYVAVGSAQTFHAVIRQSICDFIPVTDIPSSSLETYVYSHEFNRLFPYTCSSVADYLQTSRMSLIGVYGSCPESFTFAQFAICDVFVGDSSNRRIFKASNTY